MPADYALDIRQDNCPMTFVKTRLLMETMECGQTAALYLRAGEALDNLPASISLHGGKILALTEQAEGWYVLIFQKEQ